MQAYGQQAMGWGQQAAQPAMAAWGQQAAQPQAYQQAYQQAAQPVQQQAAAGQNKDVTLVVTGCTHGTVGGIVRGSFQMFGENHGRPTYKKDAQVNGLDVMSYYWDERDGPGFCGWWFGPKVGGDQVWAYHTDKAATMPPQTGWKVPYDGPVDPTFVIQYKPKAGAAPAQQPAAAWGQAQQAQGAWAQQGQQQQLMQQQQMQQMQGQKMQEQTRLEQQRVALEELKKKQQNDNATRAEAMRKQQMGLQQQKLAENKAMLEAANKNRIEEQKRKMEEMKLQQQALIANRANEQKNKEAEMAKKKLEQIAVLNVRRVMQKFRATAPDKFDDAKKEMDEVMQTNMETLGTQKDRLVQEVEQAVTTTKARIDQIQELKKKEEEKKEVENTRRRDLKEKAAALVATLEKQVTKLESESKGVAEEAEPLTGDKEMKINEIEACSSAVEEAAKEANELAKVCIEFVAKESVNIKNCPPIQGEPPATCAADLAKLVNRLNEAKKTTSTTLAKVTAAKTTRVKKAHAKERYEKTLAPFKKFDTDKDGKLSRREILTFSKTLYSFPLPSDNVDEIFKVLVKEDSKGVDKADFHRLQVMIGIARESAMDTKRKENREKREKKLASMKETLQASIEKVTELLKEATEAGSKADKAIVPLHQNKATATASEMVSQADEAEKVVEAAKGSLQKAKDAVEKLSTETEPELKGYQTSEIQKLKNQLIPVDQRSTKATAACAKFRADATKKNAVELEKLRAEGLSMIWHHQGAKKLAREDVYKLFDSKKKGKVEEGAFVKFFKTCELKEDGERMSEDDAGRLFGYLDSEEEGFLTKEQMLNLIRRFMKCVKASVLTDDVSTKSKPLRRLVEGEVLECLTGPQDAEEDILRLKVKAMSDDVEGWVTPVGNRGTVFIEDGGNMFKVVKETILTGSFVIGADKATKDRKLKVGEVVEAREWPRKEEASGLMRMKVRVKSDGQIGWVTSLGNTGVVFVEVI